MTNIKEVIVTKYAMTTGSFKMIARITDNNLAIALPRYENGYMIGKPDYHFSEEDAEKKFEEMRIKKIKSLEKQIKKLKVLKFEIKDCINPEFSDQITFGKEPEYKSNYHED